MESVAIGFRNFHEVVLVDVRPVTCGIHAESGFVGIGKSSSSEVGGQQP